MKKFYFLFLLLAPLFLCGCGSKTTIAPSGSGEDILPDDMAIECLSLCEDNIQTLCQEEIQTAIANGTSLENSVLNLSYCQLACEAEWDESTIDCVSDADTCAQFMDTAPYCIENGDTGEEANATEPGNCDTACRRYSDCASYTEGAGQADIEDAYQSCLQLCPSWSDEQRNCVANTAINSAADCARQTACVLSQVKELMGR